MATKYPKTRYTYSDYCELPDDGNRYEVIDGVLYMAPAPHPRHQRILFNLTWLFGPFVTGESALGELFFAPIDVIFASEDVFQPDLIFISRERLHIISDRGLEAAPDLVVEVLSPSTRSRDLNLKRRRYAHFGVPEYWLIDPDNRTIRTLDLSGREYVERGTYGVGDELTTPFVPGLVIPVEQVFERV